MTVACVRRGTTRRHAANRLFLEITLVMIMMILLSYAPATSRNNVADVAVSSEQTGDHGQAVAGRTVWLHLDAAGALRIGREVGGGKQEWPTILRHIQEQGIAIVVIDPDENVSFKVLSNIWGRASEVGLMVKIASKQTGG